MKTLVVNRNLIVLIISVMLLIYGIQGMSYAQGSNLCIPLLHQAIPTRLL